jgi:predicted porin
MKQTIMAVAVAGALAAPGLALAQATNVQIYGVLDLRVDSFKYGSPTTGAVSEERKAHLHTGQPNRIGFRGTEALGGGLTAFFQVESQITMDARGTAASDASGGNLWGGRPSFIGLRGGWGEVSAGLQDSSYKSVQNIWNAVPTLNHMMIIMANSNTTGTIPSPNCQGVVNSGTGAITPAGTQVCLPAVEGSATSFARTVSNSVKYISPVISGFRLNVLMEMPEYEEPSSSTPVGANRYEPSNTSYALTWSGGPFSAGLGYEEHSGARATNAVGSNRDAKDKAITIGGKWNFGAGQIGAGWEQLKYENSGVAGAENNFTVKNWVINGQYHILPNGIISAGYSHTPGASDCGAGATAASTGLAAGAVTAAANMGNAACGDNGKATVWSLAYDHILSKRTSLYAAYGRINNGAGSKYYYVAGPQGTARNGSTGGLLQGQDINAYMLGVKHTF